MGGQKMANEKRLIDKNAMIKKIKKSLCYDCEIYNVRCRDCLVYDAIGLIDAAQAVNAVEVVHGRWIETIVPDGYVQKASRLRKQCSVCGWTNACRYNYCPHCGAKLDGDGDGS